MGGRAKGKKKKVCVRVRKATNKSRENQPTFGQDQFNVGMTEPPSEEMAWSIFDMSSLNWLRSDPCLSQSSSSPSVAWLLLEEEEAVSGLVNLPVPGELLEDVLEEAESGLAN